jgi:hypothetical protein
LYFTFYFFHFFIRRFLQVHPAEYDDKHYTEEEVRVQGGGK